MKMLLHGFDLTVSLLTGAPSPFWGTLRDACAGLVFGRSPANLCHTRARARFARQRPICFVKLFAAIRCEWLGWLCVGSLPASLYWRKFWRMVS